MTLLGCFTVFTVYLGSYREVLRGWSSTFDAPLTSLNMDSSENITFFQSSCVQCRTSRMTTSSSKDLPPHWIVKTSRQNPSLSYYANVKTGQSTWKHPSLLTESELETLSKKKGKKKLQENDPELKKAKRIEIPNPATSVEQESESSRKAKFTPISCGHSAASVGNHQELNDNTGDHKNLETKQVSNDNTGDHKYKPIKFTIKMKNVRCTSSTTDSSPKKPVALHPSILLAQKIATRDLCLKVKRKVEDDKLDRETTDDEVHSAKKIKTDKEILKLSFAATKTDTLPTSENDFKNKEKHKVEETNKSTSKGGKKVANKKRRHKKHKGTVKSIPVMGLVSEEEKTDEHERDKKKVKDKEDQLYQNFIKHRSKLWKKKIYRFQDDESKKKIEPELYRDEKNSEILPDKVRPEQPKEVAAVSSEQVPYVDSLKVPKPVPVPVPSEDNTIYPKAIDMEIDEEELNIEIANFRGSASYSRLAMSEGLPDPSTCHSLASLYFVVDTNVLIGHIDFLQELKSSVVDGRESVVVVPYVALQEMDGLKKSASIGKACQAAVRWCNKHFEAKDPRVQGQTYSNYRTTLEENKGASADDLVRDYCLLLAKEGLGVCLLTNDINLRNKALMSNLSAISVKDLKSKLRNLPIRHVDPSPTPSQAVSKWEELEMNDVSLDKCERDVVDVYVQESPCHQATLSTVVPRQHEDSSGQKVRRASCSMASEDIVLFERITTSLHHTLSNILQDVMKEIYEDLWLTILKHKPPWSLKELFACWEKHWIAAMIDRFPSSMKKLLEEINNLLTARQVDVQKLLNRVQLLFSHFESEPYKKHILPVQDPSPVVVDMSEASPSTSTCSTPPSIDPHQSNTMSGVINVEKMINQVGAHITHFVYVSVVAL